MRRLSYSEKLERIAAKFGYAQEDYRNLGYSPSLFYVGNPEQVMLYVTLYRGMHAQLRWYAYQLSPISWVASEEEANYLLKPCASRKAFEERLAAFLAIQAALMEKR